MAARRRPRLGSLSEDRLLDLRLCDLGLRIDGTWLEDRIEKLEDELATRNIRIRPHFWLSDEWFSPDGITGVAIPFYLAHPRLIRLERKHILEVEGATPAGCMKLLRHEMGHVVDHAYRLHRRRRWQRTFGRSSQRYPDSYMPNPASKRFVVHLDHWYAQAHPDEDFAETFAVWLTPGSRWRHRYREWPALKKLELVDQMMSEIAGRPPEVRNRQKVDTVGRLRKTLREYYEEKRARYRGVTTSVYDEDLVRLFRGTRSRGNDSASKFLRTHRVKIRKMVARSTGEHPLALDTVLKEMIDRCRELKLRVSGSQRQLLIDLAILLAARSVEYTYRRKDWHVV